MAYATFMVPGSTNNLGFKFVFLFSSLLTYVFYITPISYSHVIKCKVCNVPDKAPRAKHCMNLMNSILRVTEQRVLLHFSSYEAPLESSIQTALSWGVMSSGVQPLQTHVQPHTAQSGPFFGVYSRQLIPLHD